MALIPLNNGLFATVDDGDWGTVMNYRWVARKRNGTSYEVTGRSGKKGSPPIFVLGRFILGVTDPKLVVVHLDYDWKNHRRNNLKVLTRIEFNEFMRDLALKRLEDPDILSESTARILEAGRKYLEMPKALRCKFRGGGVISKRGRWVARVSWMGKRYNCGQFDTEDEAHTVLTRKISELRAGINKPRQRSRTSRYKSKLRGVSWFTAANKWRATACVRGKQYFLGTFDSEAEAFAAAEAKRNELIVAATPQTN